MLNVSKQIIFADRVDGGYTYTLASRLGAMLAEAESRYGERDASYTILGLEFTDLAHPQVWYPNARRHIVIQLTAECLLDPLRAYYQMAHECIHLLDPTGGAPRTNVLEEGLAVSFQQDYMRAVFKEEMTTDLPGYIDAGVKADALLALDPGVVRTLRESGKKLYSLTAEDIIAASPAVSPELANVLVAPFSL